MKSIHTSDPTNYTKAKYPLPILRLETKTIKDTVGTTNLSQTSPPS